MANWVVRKHGPLTLWKKTEEGEDAPMRLLVQQPCLAPYRTPLFKALAEHPSLDVTFMASSVQITGEVQEGGSELPVKGMDYFKFRGGLKWQRGLIREVANGDYDAFLLNCDVHYLSNIIATLVAKRRGVRVLMWGHGVRHNRIKPKIKVYRAFCNLADMLLYYSDDGAEFARQSGHDSKKIRVAWNSVDTTEILKVRNAQPFDERKRIVVLGRLIPRKKTDIALKAFAQAQPRLGERATLTLIGDGPCKLELQALADRMGITDRVEFIGATYEENKIAAFMNDAWVTISPGYVGLNAIHSLAYGVPVVYARDENHSPEVAALVDGFSSVSVPSDSAEGFAQALIQLHENRSLAQKTGSQGLQVVQSRFSKEKMVSVIVEAIETSLGRTRVEEDSIRIAA